MKTTIEVQIEMIPRKRLHLYVAFDWGQNIGKIILQPANLSMTQIYLGKVPDTEAMRWIENLYA